MCGILGIQSTKAINEYLFIKSLNLMSHRGPDSEKIYKKNNTLLGFRRLSIIDLSSQSNQPMSSFDGKLTIIFNGEIYNYLEIKKKLVKQGYKFQSTGDTEVLLNGYHAWGPKVLDKINGMFAFAILNNDSGEIFLARDRLGIKPLYYYRKNNTFVFSSEMNSIIDLVKNNLSIDYTAIVDFFTYLYIPEDKTIFKNIKKLLPGHYAILNNNTLSIKKYWDINFNNKNENLSLTDSVDALDSLINDSVKMRLVSDVPVGSFLSGGIDSSLISYYASQNHKNIKTFYADFNNNYNNDISVSNFLKTDHKRKKVNNNDIDPFHLMKSYGDLHYDTSSLPFYQISKLAKEDVTVCLSGDGGDELFYGYSWFNEYINSSKYIFIQSIYNYLDPSQHIFNFSYLKGFKYKKYIIQNDLERYVYLRGGYTKLYLDKILPKNILNEIPKDYDNNWLYRKYLSKKSINLKSRLQYLDIKNFMVNDILLKVDMMSMLNSLEVRVPFLDHRIVEFVFSLNKNFINENSNKFILKELFRKKLPADFLEKKKIGFGFKNLRFSKPGTFNIFSSKGNNDVKLKNMKYLVESYL
tara:strand:+ start:4624 stop:6363 length:1740 start_codon:yes stop_codon:yes gene_type:complete